MMPADARPTREQQRALPVLVSTRGRADAVLLERVLKEAGFETAICEDVEALCMRIPGAATVVIGEETLVSASQHALIETLKSQPEWSDFPMIVMTAADQLYEHSRQLFEQIEGCAHPILLQRPVRKYTLLSAVRAAVRARARQHQVRDELAHRRRAEHALREADRRKDEFLATLGHELRNPLASVSTALEVTALTEDPERVAKSRAIMERQVAQLSRLVDDLLEVSRITRGKLQLDKRPVELAAIVKTAVEDIEESVREGGHELAIELPADPVVLYADPVRLGQVFANLLNNAARYTPFGGRIRLTGMRDDEGVRVSVHDTGIGLEPETLETIFEMFGQVGDAHGPHTRGLGIGLSLVQSLVELHGGTIRAYSGGLDQGSEFRIWLPVTADGPPSGSEDEAQGSEGRARRCRVLVAEDNQDAAETLSALLELLGHEVRTELDGEAAVAAVPEFEPDVALIDLGLPKLTGYEVARRLRAGSRGGRIVLAAVTGWSQEWHQKQAREAGFDLHLTKPLKLETLRSLLATVSAHGRDAREPAVPRRGPARAEEPAQRLPRRRPSGE